ncbi:apolipoprotein N-acyltransferase [Pseudoponticoccus marisrubri]|uniref:Apolipoprotein N-acyltransferase n=1 Tax=Pseudoponticoccus marisrubri TaxID=1685382 RepID=A0A0W7WKV6_9RHOB|nr:apolipoprotein N-acyltransferase [Pseudoponticoccus marisrubri]KUF11167.1 apolipoprotein N-acyltransferase [Pseudoponticoccus marisrubri]
MPDSLRLPRRLTGAALSGWARLPVAVLCGVAMGLGQAPYDLWPVAFLGYVASIWLFLVTPGGVRAAGTGWAVGLGYFGFGLGWIVEPFFVDAAATGWMAPFALVGLGGGLGLFWALAFWGAAQARRWPLAALVVAWSAAELARAYVLTGFPWALVSYLWAPVPPIQWVALIGPHGLTLLTLTLAATAARLLVLPARRPALLGLWGAAMAGFWAVGLALVPPLQELEGRPVVRLIQPNAAQHEKWDPAKIPLFYQRQLSFTQAPPQRDGNPPALVVWPETALPMLLHRAGDALGQVAHAAGEAGVIVGLQRSDGGRYYNSLVQLDASGGLVQVYDKHHLVPFGEYMPAAAVFARWNIAGLAARAEGGYTPGPGPQVLDLGPLGLALPLICYEAVFPQDVYRAPVRPDMLLQVTNDAWFGQFSGPFQHLAQARIRAIEQGLPLLRAANTGVSAVIDGGGRILAQLPLGEAGYVDAALPPPLRRTPYARVGDLPVLVVLMLSGLALFAAGRVFRN